MRLLLDEMFSPVIAEQLRSRIYDVIAVTERPDLRSQPDEILFAFAQREGFTFVTENIDDFRRVGNIAIQQGHVPYGLLYVTNRQFPRGDDRTLGRLILALEAVLTSNPDVRNLERWLSS